jgi:hypothetical protein
LTCARSVGPDRAPRDRIEGGPTGTTALLCGSGGGGGGGASLVLGRNNCNSRASGCKGVPAGAVRCGGGRGE